MKDKFPQPFILGICFVCKSKCSDDAYCHTECAYSMSEEKERRIKEANRLAREE